MRVQCVVIQVTLNQWHSTQHIFHLTDVKCRQYCCRSFVYHGNTLPLHAAVQSKADGFKSAKKNSEFSLCRRGNSISPVGHRVHLKNSCDLAYQTSPPPVISKSCMTLKSPNGSILKGYGATRHTQSCMQ